MSGETAADDPAALTRRIAAGERRAEEELVERYGERLSFLLRRWTRDPAAAQDLYQETFRLALEKIRQGEVRDAAKLPAFLCSLARNLSTYHYRRHAVQAAREAGAEAAEGLPAAAGGPLDQLLLRERAGLVRRVLGEMHSERDREILSRFYIAGQEKDAICVDLGLADSHFKRVLFRARERYRELFEKRFGRGAEQ